MKNFLLQVVKAKMNKEYQDYLELLRISSPNKVICNSYEIVFKSAILSYIDTDYFCTYDDLVFLNSLSNPLSFLYENWFKTDCDGFNELKNFLGKILDEGSRKYKDKLKYTEV